MKLYCFSDYCRSVFGEKLYKLSLDGGFTCPNRDGAVSFGGCSFCDGGSGYFTAPGTIEQQIEQQKKQLSKKYKGGRYIAYFQSYSATYRPVSELECLYSIPLNRPEIAALAIATRPDCLPPETLRLLGAISHVKPLIVELGLQTIHQQTADGFHRGYKTAVFDQAVRALKGEPIHVVAHLMIGLPGEGKEQLLASVRHLNRLGVHGVKFHLLHILKDTAYEKAYEQGTLSVLSMEEYGDLLCAALAVLDPGIVVHRITGDGPKDRLIAPLWSTDKKRVLQYLRDRISAID